MEGRDSLLLSSAVLFPETLGNLAKAKARIRSLIAHKCVLRDSEDSGQDVRPSRTLLAFQQLLVSQSNFLESLELAGSNISGLGFYHSKAIDVDHSSDDPAVSVESYSSTGEPIVRDEKAENLKKIDGIEHFYVKTLFQDSKYVRLYVPLGWMQVLSKVDMSGTPISGDGVSALVAACCNSLKELSLKDCENVTDSGLFSISKLCVALVEIDVSGCSMLTPFGIMALAQMSDHRSAKLKVVRLSNCPLLSPKVQMAFCVAMNSQGFVGEISTDSDCKLPDSRGFSSAVEKVMEDNSCRFIDLALEDITSRVIQSYDPEVPTEIDNSGCAIILNFSDELIDDELLRINLSTLSKISQCSVFALDISGTFVTENGLKSLACLDKLKALRVSRCPSIFDKGLANKTLAPVLAKMTDLKFIDFSDTKLSGKSLLPHKDLKLESFIVSRCPISYHGINQVDLKSSRTLRILNVSGCRFINARCLEKMLQFPSLEILDASFCDGLKGFSISSFRKREFHSKLRNLLLVGICGLGTDFGTKLYKFLVTHYHCKDLVVVVDEASEAASVDLTDSSRFAMYESRESHIKNLLRSQSHSVAQAPLEKAPEFLHHTSSPIHSTSDGYERPSSMESPVHPSSPPTTESRSPTPFKMFRQRSEDEAVDDEKFSYSFASISVHIPRKRHLEPQPGAGFYEPAPTPVSVISSRMLLAESRRLETEAVMYSEPSPISADGVRIYSRVLYVPSSDPGDQGLYTSPSIACSSSATEKGFYSAPVSSESRPSTHKVFSRTLDSGLYSSPKFLASVSESKSSDSAYSSPESLVPKHIRQKSAPKTLFDVLVGNSMTCGARRKSLKESLYDAPISISTDEEKSVSDAKKGLR